MVESNNSDILDRKRISGEIKERINENKERFDKLKEILFKSNSNDNGLMMEKNEKNIIILILEIKPEEVNKEIFFFDNYKYMNTNNIKREKGFLQEIESIKSKIKLNIINPNDEINQIPFDNKFNIALI